MTCDDLKRKLQEDKVPSDWYSIQDVPYDMHMCLLFEGEQWVVFWSERGGRDDLRCFTAEIEACAFFHERMMTLMRSSSK